MPRSSPVEFGIFNMTEKFCDLHLHSLCSDGSDTPTELCKRAKNLGMSAIALTDHNTVSGLREFAKACDDFGIEGVPSIEITTEHEGKELHVVGLFLNEKAFVALGDFLAELCKTKIQSNKNLIQSLKNAGYSVSWDELVKFSPQGNINRAVIALYLVEKGILQTVKEGFKTILSEKAGHYKPAKRPKTLETIKFLSDLGVVSILAHPFISLDEDEVLSLLPRAKEQGLCGIETNYSLYDEATHEFALKTANDVGLLASGGSDYHGNAKPTIEIGCSKVPYEYYLALKQRAKELSDNLK